MIVPIPAAEKKTAPARRARAPSPSIASKAAMAAAVMKKISIMSKMTSRPKIMQRGERARTAPAAIPARAPPWRRANQAVRAMPARAKSAEGSRAASSSTPKSV